MKHLLPALKFTIFMTLLLGLIYPLMMTGITQVLFSENANGQLIKRGDVVVGSKLIAQNFEKVEYFWPRPSAVGFNPLPSGGSNLGQAAAGLKQAVDERRTKLKAAHPEQTGEPPQDLLFASGSGLDPHISPEAAYYQLQRVAKARNMSPAEVQNTIDKVTEARQFGILGEKTVNVLALNLALDKAQGIEK
ncbi:potassium-transporting ATPase subunit KdpC [Pseudobdellovibrio sp. HCB154]|uniref:potassium-transporting ATPase subunit KdpC n=1 Tax=Pseudobdellovibrio sp. HCB154 TaxID=3386277 RepID=UPI0039174649